METVKRQKSYERSECLDGMEAVEGVIILTLMTFLFVFFLSFGFLFYQQCVVATAANDTATRIAQSYAYGGADPVMGFISRDMRVSLSPYRYWTGRLANHRAYMGENYAFWYLDKASFAIPQGNPDIQVRTEHDGLAQRHVEVEITATYEIPLGGILTYIGVNRFTEYHAVGRAVCVDLSDYIYTVNTANAFSEITLGSKTLGTINSVAGAAQSVRNFIAKKLEELFSDNE